RRSGARVLDRMGPLCASPWLADSAGSRRRRIAGAETVQVQPDGGVDPAGRHHSGGRVLAPVAEPTMPLPAPRAVPRVAAGALVALSAVALVLGACNRERDKAADAPGVPPAAGAVEPAAPMAYESKSPYADVSLTLPEALKT